MKKFYYIAACLAIVACSKDENACDPLQKEGVYFHKGQVVTISVSGTNGGSKAVGKLSGDDIDFQWENGDKIKVTVGSESAEFSIISGAGEESATFQGVMPGEGSSFDVQYPYAGLEVTALKNQTYDPDNAIPHDMMLATASGCTLDEPIELEPQYSALMLNLYGTDKTVGKITVTTLSSVITDKTLEIETYILDCSNGGSGVALGTTESNPTHFCLVMPAITENSVTFNVDVFSEANKLINSLETDKYHNFPPKQFNSMAAREVKSISGTDLSGNSTKTANCYIVDGPGVYFFKATKGNGAAISGINSVKIVWESFGSDINIKSGYLIRGVNYYPGSGNISFSTSSSTYKEGNAVIAAYSSSDGTGEALWSWHIWLTDKPAEQAYNNSAGTLMDRNLGATSATQGDVCALGLLYQWGRKDPFLNANGITSSTSAVSTLASWPVYGTPDSGNTLDYSIQHPTTFITNNTADWYGKSEHNNNLWGTDKTIYDPCPYGWKVLTGGTAGVWPTALDTADDWTTSSNWNGTYKGMDFSATDKKLASANCWYPATGYRQAANGSLGSVGSGGYYWTSTDRSSTTAGTSYEMYFGNTGVVRPASGWYRANALSVRCMK